MKIGAMSIWTIFAILGQSGYSQSNTFPSSGSAGVGTTSPSEILHLKSTGPARILIEADTDNANETDNAQIHFSQDGGIVTGRVGFATNTNHFEISNNYATVDADIHFSTWGQLRMTIDGNGKVGIGMTSPSAKFDLYESNSLGSTVGNSQVVTAISGNVGSNTFKKKIWLMRDSNGSDWYSSRWHDGVSVDGSFGTPGTDTRTWWERDPSSHIQSWGSSASTYMTLKGGNLGIGTTTPDNRLDVKGTIRAEEVIVETGWSDYVFEDGYELPTLDEVESHIEENGHLPGIPSAEEIAKNGVSLGDSQRMLLEKVEELVLYTIELNRRLNEKDEQIESLRQTSLELLQRLDGEN